MRKILITALCIAVAYLSGCGANTKENVEEPVKEITTVKSSEAYLPVDTFDKDGLKLPYVPSENPYALQVEQVESQAVTDYISARRAYKAKNYSHAKKVLAQLTERYKELSGPWVMLGDIALEQKDTVGAIENYIAATKVNPENVNAYLRLAKAYKDNGEFSRSLNTYTELLGIWKDFPEAHLNLAVLYDLYFNEALKAQKHMEAYVFLAGERNVQVEQWLAEIRERTGVSYSIEAGVPEASPAELMTTEKVE